MSEYLEKHAHMGEDDIVALRLEQHDEQLKEIRESLHKVADLLTKLDATKCPMPGSCVQLGHQIELAQALSKEKEHRLLSLEKALDRIVKIQEDTSESVKVLIQHDVDSQLKFARQEAKAGVVGGIAGAVVTGIIGILAIVGHFVTAWIWHVPAAGK